jgi:RNA polymerase sigma-70 factor, ECF subfamily
VRDLLIELNRMAAHRNRQDEMDDDRLIAALARGEDAPLRELFDRHAPWVAARLRRSMPVDAVEDVVQETFIAVWRGASGYAGGGAVGAWIWGIARRQAALWARRHGRPAEILDEVASEDPAAAAIRSVDLERALAALGPDSAEGRRLIRMVYLEERSVAEVAAELGVRPGTVKSRLFHLRRRLRTALLGEGA